MMDINALKTFLEVTKTNHFGQAADNLFVSQSTVSARIKALEDNLGTKLFVRQRSNIHLSPAGEAFVPHAKSILTLWSRAQRELVIPKGVRDSLVVGGLSGLWNITLQNWLTDVLRDEPDLAVSADIYSASSLVKQIMNGTMDLAFLYEAPHGMNLISQPLRSIRLRLVSSKRHKDVASALAGGYINVDWGLDFAVQMAANFPDLPAAKITTGSGKIAYQYLRRNKGSAYLAEPLVEEAISTRELYFVPKAPVFERTAYAVYHKDNEKAGLLQRLLKILQ